MLAELFLFLLFLILGLSPLVFLLATSQLAKLFCLAPSLIEALLTGTQALALLGQQLLHAGSLLLEGRLFLPQQCHLLLPGLELLAVKGGPLAQGKQASLLVEAPGVVIEHRLASLLEPSVGRLYSPLLGAQGLLGAFDAQLLDALQPADHRVRPERVASASSK